MTTTVFNEAYALGIEIMDEQHRRYFELLGKLVAARAAGGGTEAVLEALDDMVSYVDEHFDAEERYMLEFGYADYEAHRAMHVGFVRKIMAVHRGVRNDEQHLDDDLVDYLGTWFTEHIRQEDPKYAELFRANGL